MLENHHWRSAIGCLLESHVAEKLSPIRQDLESQISSLILATDITRQPEFLKKFNVSLTLKWVYVCKGEKEWEDRHIIIYLHSQRSIGPRNHRHYIGDPL